MRGDPHATGRLLRAGPTATTARRAAICLHGRGGDGAGIIDVVAGLGQPDVALFAPEAAGRTWWPSSFLAPMDELEPWLSSALAAVDRAIEAAVAEGSTQERLVLLGFSQGGCLAMEHAARHGLGLSAVFGLSGGLLGMADADGPASEDLHGHRPKRFDYDTDLSGLAVHIGCHEADPYIPLRRVRESASVLEGLGARVSLVLKPGPGHSLLPEDVAALSRALAD